MLLFAQNPSCCTSLTQPLAEDIDLAAIAEHVTDQQTKARQSSMMLQSTRHGNGESRRQRTSLVGGATECPVFLINSK